MLWVVYFRWVDVVLKGEVVMFGFGLNNVFVYVIGDEYNKCLVWV